MGNIADIDKNFKVQAKIEQQGIRFFDVLSKPFEIYGIYMDDGKFRRMPENVAENVNNGVLRLHANCAGGRVRFRTNSPYVAISAKMGSIGKMAHFPLTGSAGFDMYINDGNGETYERTFVPPFDIETGYESLVNFDNAVLRDITINFPLYSEVKELYVGIDQNAALEEPTPYIDKKPIVYYGSSITQGGCASRPGNCYQAYISRRFNCDYINLGFSGNARAEDTIAQYIKKLDMSVFVYDYDHNAPTIEHLEKTHEKMFETIRRENADLPVIIMSAPKWTLNDEWKKRRDIVEATYKNALAAGDKNVYFLSGTDLMRLCENNGTVDNCHPNDLGFVSMAKAVGDVIEKIWK